MRMARSSPPTARRARGVAVRLAPVGAAFRHVHDGVVAAGGEPTAADSPFLALYDPDGSHPSPRGAYLAACVLAATATAFSWVITYLRIPQIVTAGLLSITQSKFIMLIIINILLLILGCFMNMWSIILIMTPILLPVVQSFGMHPVQFGIMLILNLGIGLLTPPVGQVLFVGSSVSGLSVERLTKALLPQFLVMIVALLLITYVPALTMYLPTVFGYVS